MIHYLYVKSFFVIISTMVHTCVFWASQKMTTRTLSWLVFLTVGDLEESQWLSKGCHYLNSQQFDELVVSCLVFEILRYPVQVHSELRRRCCFEHFLDKYCWASVALKKVEGSRKVAVSIWTVKVACRVRSLHGARYPWQLVGLDLASRPRRQFE